MAITIATTAKCPKCEADMVPLFYWNTYESMFWRCVKCGHKVTNDHK